MPAPTPTMTPRERRGRLLLAAAFGLLFLTIFVSMLTSRVLWPLVGIAVGLALVGGVSFALGRR